MIQKTKVVESLLKLHKSSFREKEIKTDNLTNITNVTRLFNGNRLEIARLFKVKKLSFKISSTLRINNLLELHRSFIPFHCLRERIKTGYLANIVHTTRIFSRYY